MSRPSGVTGIGGFKYLVGSNEIAGHDVQTRYLGVVIRKLVIEHRAVHTQDNSI